MFLFSKFIKLLKWKTQRNNGWSVLRKIHMTILSKMKIRKGKLVMGTGA